MLGRKLHIFEIHSSKLVEDINMNDAHCILVEFVPPDAEKSRFIPARLDVQVAVLGDISFEEDSENIKKCSSQKLRWQKSGKLQKKSNYCRECLEV